MTALFSRGCWTHSALAVLLLAAACGPGAESAGDSRAAGSEAVPGAAAQADSTPGYDIYARPGSTPAELGTAGWAKVLCSAVFVSGRDPEEARRNSGFFFLEPADRSRITEVAVDRERGEVRMTFDGRVTRTARFYGDQGCVILPEGADSVFFEPVPVESALPDASTTPWPMGDSLPRGPRLPEGMDRAGIEAAVDAAFSDPDALTAAFLVTWRGRIIAERYMPGIDSGTQLESWSMGKSLTATLMGLLIQEGVYTLDQPAPVGAWREEGDPRGAIRIADLMRMSSGLRFIAPRDPDYTPDMGYTDHMYIYTGAVDAFEYSISRPLQFPPGTEGRYRNSDPLTLGYLVKKAVEARGESYLQWPQKALFDKIGIRRQVLEPDPYGNFLLTGYDYGTARNWARLGNLYLQDGVWMGERLLPEGFVDFVSTPAPAWDEPVYGGLFWINGDSAWSVPTDAYFMAGGGGQRTFIIPSHDLVVVRLGHFRGNDAGMRTLDRALALLMEAMGG